MAWPTVPVTTTAMDQGTDIPANARSDFLDAVNKLNDMIASRGVASGVCDLDATTKIPVARMPSDFILEEEVQLLSLIINLR